MFGAECGLNATKRILSVAGKENVHVLAHTLRVFKKIVRIYFDSQLRCISFNSI